MFIRHILPVGVRRRLRLGVDAFFCRSDLGLKRIGGDAAWWVAPSLVRADSKILSGGAGNDISFEIALVEQIGCSIALFDPSPTGSATFAMAMQPFANESQLRSISTAARSRLHYYAVGLSQSTQRATFAAPRSAAEGSFTITAVADTDRIEFECLSPSDAIERAGFDRIDLLKIDIEGFEYGFLEALLATEHRPNQIAVEFHHFLPHIPISRTVKMIQSLRAAGYKIAHKEQCDYLFIHESAIACLK